jgi:hypothetical protein
MRYTAAEIVQIGACAEKMTLRAEVLAAIDAIYMVVGAETYSSSPVFPVKETKKKKPKASLSDFTSNLNKLSEATFDVVAPLILACLENMDDASRESAAEYLVQTACGTAFGTEWYAKMFGSACKRWNVFYDKFTDRQDEYKEALKTGEANQRFFLNFAIQLSKNGAIGSMQVLAEKIHKMVEAGAPIESRKSAIEEWSEHLALLVKNKVPLSADLLQPVTLMRPATHPGISNKTLFKYMDMVESLR